jgi:hypothetical protein
MLLSLWSDWFSTFVFAGRLRFGDAFPLAFEHHFPFKLSDRGEGRHSLGRAIFHGKRGELRQRYREGQEDQLGALGLVVNMIVLWNTIYVEAALNQLRLEGYQISEADIARLSPLIHDHINMLGRYSFAMPETVARGELRPLRNPIVDQE